MGGQFRILPTTIVKLSYEMNSSLKPSSVTSLSFACLCTSQFVVCPVSYQWSFLWFKMGCQSPRILIPGFICWLWTLRFGVSRAHPCLDHTRREMRSRQQLTDSGQSPVLCVLMLQVNKKLLLIHRPTIISLNNFSDLRVATMKDVLIKNIWCCFP